MTVVALIPARAGSKRIPGKNIRDFSGRPILARVIEVVRYTSIFDRIVVSTDGDGIAAVATESGAEVLRREPHLSDDDTGLLEVVRSEITRFIEVGVYPTVVACILPTAVLISQTDLATAVTAAKENKNDFFVAVGRFSYPVQRALRLGPKSEIEMVWPENYSSRSQDLEPLFHDAGQMYVGSLEAWVTRTTMFSAPVSGLVVDDWRVQDIDVESDWIQAERLWRLLQYGQDKEVN